MCELLGITSERLYNANALLKGFYTHSQTNVDGWGLAVFRGKGASMEKEPVKALDSVYLRQRLSREVVSRNILAHVRRATVGQAEYANCHPFIWDDESGRTWTLMHNGTIFNPGGTCDYAARQEGSTDSERLLLYIIDRVNALIHARGEAYMNQVENRFRLIDDIVLEMSKDNKLNLLLFDSEYMYVHTNCPGTLHKTHSEDTVIIATRPVYGEEFDELEWEQVEMNRLHVYHDGKNVWNGTGHNNVFDESQYDFISLYSAFAAL